MGILLHVTTQLILKCMYVIETTVHGVETLIVSQKLLHT